MMVESYRKVIDLAVTAPSPSAQTRAALPTHLLADGTEHAAGLLRDAGFPDDVISAARLTTFA
jgi:hypothetical protein